ncbi:hypothetical protein RvY_06469, partial [Ramazzottius varieornatus]
LLCCTSNVLVFGSLFDVQWWPRLTYSHGSSPPHGLRSKIRIFCTHRPIPKVQTLSCG